MARSYPKNIFEQWNIELNQMQNYVYALENARGGDFPTYDADQLPSSLFDGQAFNTTQGGFCVKYGDNIYCMPKPRAVGIGPVIYSAQQQSTVSWSGSPADVYKVKTADVSGEHTIYWSDQYNSASPVWGTDFERIIYCEVRMRWFGAPVNTTKLCIIKADGTDRRVIHDSGGRWGIDGSGGSGYPYYYNYAMSPDGEKVAFITPNTGTSGATPNYLRCAWADGSGDCGGGNLAAYPYGFCQWDPTSTYIYGSWNNDIDAVKFDDSSITWPVWNFSELGAQDYCWINNAHNKLASAWYYGSPSGHDGVFNIIDTTGGSGVSAGIQEFAWYDYQCPWHYPNNPREIFWAPDDSYLILTTQWNQYPNYYNFAWHNTGIAIRTTPDLSSYIEYLPPDESSDRGIVNWTLATVGGEVKVLAACFFDNYPFVTRGIGIFQWNADTGAQEGWLVSNPDWSDPTEPTWDRYSITGLAVSTAAFGCQIWDI